MRRRRIGRDTLANPEQHGCPNVAIPENNLVSCILAQKSIIGVTRERAMGQMGGKTGEWGEGPAGATVPYDVRGLHAAQGAIWTAPLGDNRSKLKNKTRESAIVPKKTCTGP